MPYNDKDQYVFVVTKDRDIYTVKCDTEIKMNNMRLEYHRAGWNCSEVVLNGTVVATEWRSAL